MNKKIYADCPEMMESMIFEDHPGAVILSLKHDGTGTVAAVFEDGAVRWYWAHEFTDDSYREGRKVIHNVVSAYGYKTRETACYMGDRYKVPSLWGPYFDEVFTRCGTVWDSFSNQAVPE